jgi:hypothetical protein
MIIVYDEWHFFVRVLLIRRASPPRVYIGTLKISQDTMMSNAALLIPIVPHFLVNMGDLNKKRKWLQLPCDVDAREPQDKPSNACNFEVLEVYLACRDEGADGIFYDHWLEGTLEDEDVNIAYVEKGEHIRRNDNKIVDNVK